MIDNSKLYYLATPYSKWEAGITMAFVEAAVLTASLLEAGYRVYSPICHTHPIAMYGNIDPLAHDIWLPFDEAMMKKCDGLMVALMDGWSQSKGVAHEIDFFRRAMKPILYLNPENLEVANA